MSNTTKADDAPRKPEPMWFVRDIPAVGSGALQVYGYRKTHGTNLTPVNVHLFAGLTYIEPAKASHVAGEIKRLCDAGKGRVIDIAKTDDGEIVALVRKSIDAASLDRLLVTSKSPDVLEATRARLETVRRQGKNMLVQQR